MKKFLVFYVTWCSSPNLKKGVHHEASPDAPPHTTNAPRESCVSGKPGLFPICTMMGLP
jgi:hypothetical protein